MVVRRPMVVLGCATTVVVFYSRIPSASMLTAHIHEHEMRFLNNEVLVDFPPTAERNCKTTRCITIHERQVPCFVRVASCSENVFCRIWRGFSVQNHNRKVSHFLQASQKRHTKLREPVLSNVYSQHDTKQLSTYCLLEQGATTSA